MHYDQELKSAQETLPINGFDEMIMLTNEGKLWRFPIDNEQDIDEAEAQIPFHEHVFLDSYLEKFPQIEPIQEFMVLALNGLSQNSFLSLNEKKEIIDWYIKYFKENEELIKKALESENEKAEQINQLKKN
jgi:small subunit ribosomal protein S31